MDWRIDAGKTGLLVVDLQERLLPVIHEGPRVVAKAAQAVRLARLFSLPLFLSEQVPEKIGATTPAVLEALGDAAVQRVTKSSFSASPALPEKLPAAMLVVGIETHICVRQTVYDLRARGLSVYLLADACGSRSPLDYQLALEEMRQDKVVVTSVEAVGWELTGGADQPHFRDALKILK